MEVWAALTMCVCLFTMLAAISEREELGHRVRRSIPSGFFKRLPAFFHFSGNASGVAWTILVLTITQVLLLFDDTWDKDFSIVSLGLSFFLVAYALSGHFLQRNYFHKRLPRGFTWVISIGLLFIFSVGAWLLSFFIYPKSWDSMGDSGWLHLLNPFSLSEDKWWPLILISSGGWCLIMFVLEKNWFFARWRAFRAPEQAPEGHVQ